MILCGDVYLGVWNQESAWQQPSLPDLENGFTKLLFLVGCGIQFRNDKIELGVWCSLFIATIIKVASNKIKCQKPFHFEILFGHMVPCTGVDMSAWYKYLLVLPVVPGTYWRTRDANDCVKGEDRTQHLAMLPLQPIPNALSRWNVKWLAVAVSTCTGCGIACCRCQLSSIHQLAAHNVFKPPQAKSQLQHRYHEIVSISRCSMNENKPTFASQSRPPNYVHDKQHWHGWWQGQKGDISPWYQITTPLPTTQSGGVPKGQLLVRHTVMEL